MPALPPVNQVARIDIRQQLGADVDVLNILHVGFTGTMSPAAATGLASQISGDWDAQFLPLQNDSILHVSTTFTDLTSTLGDTATHTSGAVGSHGGSHTNPGGVALVVREHIARRYRGGRPRIYFAGTDQNDLVTLQQWNGTTVTDWGGAAAAFLTDSLAWSNSGVSTSGLVNVSYFHGFTNFTFPSGRIKALPTLRVTPLVDPITSMSVNPKVASQRRRNLQSS